MVKIYFGAAPLIITDDLTAESTEVAAQYINPSIKETYNLINKLKKTPQTTIIQTNNTATVFEIIKENFTLIQASGGLACTPDEQVLLIFRKGKWDLPKGKLDDGETLETCALREVEEETGLNEMTLGKKLDVTYHTYQEKGQDILKESHWYLMATPKAFTLTPQTEEDIQECRWVPKKELRSYIQEAHPSVADVLNKWLNNYF